jgi:20S proteasome alpha/beta subunit
VTIAAGLRCTDGVVLCADTEVSIPGWLKFPGSKIRMNMKLPFQPVFTFAGDLNFCQMFINKLASRLAMAGPSMRQAVTAIEEEAVSIHDTFRGEDYEVQSDLLLTLWTGKNPGKRDLYHIGHGVVAPVQQACLGAGQPIAQSIIAELFNSNMTMGEACFAALYMLIEAKAYAAGCGKDSQILCLGNNGGWELFPAYPEYPTIQELEASYVRYKRLLRPLLLRYGNLGVSQRDFEKSLESFKETALRWRQEILTLYHENIERLVESQVAADEEERADQDEDFTPTDDPSSPT